MNGWQGGIRIWFTDRQLEIMPFKFFTIVQNPMHEIRTYSYEFPHAPAAPLPSRGGVRGGVCIILHLKSYQPHPCPSPAWEGSGCATFSDDRGSFVNVLLVSHEYYARCGRWALSLRTVRTLVTDGGRARYGRWARSLRTLSTLVADFGHARYGRWARSLRTSACKPAFL